MARTSKVAKANENEITSLTIDIDTANNLISERIQLGEELINMPILNVEALSEAKSKYREWSSYNNELLKRIFSTSEVSNEYSAFLMYGFSSRRILADDIRNFRDEFKTRINRLISIRTRLPLFASLIPGIEEIKEKQKDEPAVDKVKELTNEIFIVHGRDEAVKLSVKIFLGKLGLNPIILSEQPNGGRTVIEKFEANADVGFAVVLLTPDDIGGLNLGGAEQKPRARQNVIFELGYFVGKLGRNKVCALYNQTVELPSDIVGVAYVALDAAGAWQLELAKELRAAGYNIDMNKLI